jgi:hypothetical protein
MQYFFNDILNTNLMIFHKNMKANGFCSKMNYQWIYELYFSLTFSNQTQQESFLAGQ